MWVNKLVHKNKLHFGTQNVGILQANEIVDTMIRGMVAFMCLQETKWIEEKTKEVDTSEFKL